MQHFSLELFRKDDTSFELRILKDQSLQVTHKVEQSEVDALQAATSQDYKITAPDLVQRGEQLFNWVDQHTKGWLRGTRQQPHAMALTIEVREAGLRHLPWELLHDGTDFLCAHPLHLFTPLRRVTTAERKQSWQPQKRQLGILFMASSPENTEPVLDFEAEDSGILQATAKKPLDLQVEESGSLAGLQERLSEYEESPDILHLSGHADIIGDSMQPVFLLEDELGQCEPVTPLALARTLLEANAKPRLIFLSGCRTGESSHQHGMLSFSEQMVDAGVPIVLGWALPVGDQAASKAAAILYEKLATGFEIAQAVALTRQQLLENRSPYWHLLRVYVDGSMLKPLVAKGKLRHRPHNTPQQFLDAGGRVPVCARTEFIGRRRLLQRSLRSLRTWYGEEAYAEGVLLYGMGGLGKSSTAARLVDRLQNSHQAVVCYGGLDETVLLTALGKALPKAQNLLNDAEQTLDNRLRTLFEPEDNPYSTEPLLLVFDDFEQNIPKALRQQGQINYNPDSLQVLHSVLQAIHESHSDTRVIVTSRFDVPVPKPCRLHLENPQTLHGADLHKKLAQLPALQIKEHQGPVQDAENTLRRQAIDIAAGNPRLLEWLNKVLQEDRDKLPVESLFAKLAVEEDRFREDVLIEALLDAQTRSARRTLACTALYRLPVQLGAIAVLEENSDTHQNLQTLARTGLVEVTPSNDGTLYFVSNLLDAALSGELNEEETQRLAAKAAKHLYSEMIDESPELINREILRLAIVGLEKQITFEVGVSLIGGMFQQQQRFREADSLCEQILAFTEHPVILSFRGMTRMLLGTGDPEKYFDHADQLLKEFELNDRDLEEAIVINWTMYSSLLIQKGKPEEAKVLLEKAMPLAKKIESYEMIILVNVKLAEIAQAKGLPEEAIALYQSAQAHLERINDPAIRPYIEMQLASIEQGRGDMDGALEQYYRNLSDFEEQGNLQQTARTLGQIADILEARGQLDEALNIRQNEELPVYEKLGDVRSKAVTERKIADIFISRGQLDEGLEILRQRCIPPMEKIGAIRDIAVFKGIIADILQARGQLDEALNALQNDVLPIFEKLGDARSKAVTMGKIADILQARGQLDDTLSIRQNDQLPVYEKLGDVRGKAITLGKIADILQARGQLDEALSIRQNEELPVYEKLGDVREKAVTERKIADIFISRGQLDEGLEILRQRCIPPMEKIGAIRDIAVFKGIIADTLWQQDPAKHAETIRDYLNEALVHFQTMQLPGETKWIERLFSKTGLPRQAPADQTRPLTPPSDKQSPL